MDRQTRIELKLLGTDEKGEVRVSMDRQTRIELKPGYHEVLPTVVSRLDGSPNSNRIETR